MHHAEPTSARIRTNPSVQIRPDTSGQIRASNEINLERDQYELENDALSLETTRPDPDDGFDLFWQRYPRKTGKEPARRAWRRLSGQQRLNALAGIGSHVEHWRRSATEAQFIPHPATWLNGRRWEDELESSWQTGPNLSPAMRTIRDRLEAVQNRTLEVREIEP